MTIEAYNRQVTGSSVVMKAGRNPSSLTRALGGGLEQAGDALLKMRQINDQAAEKEKEADFEIAKIEKGRKQAATIATKAGQLAEVEERLAASRTGLPEYSAPGAQGYAKARAAEVDKEFDGVLADVTDPEELNVLGPQVARARARHKIDGQSYEESTFRTYQGDQLNKWVDTKRNGLFRDPTGASLDEVLGEFDTMVDGMKLDGRNGPLLKQVGRGQLVTGMMDGLLEKGDYAGVKAILASGKLDDVLPPEAIQRYDQQADNAAVRAEKEAELQQSEAREQARANLRTLEARLGTDNPPAASEWSQALQAATAAGVPEAETIEAAKKADTAIEQKAIGGYSTPVLEQEQAAIAARRNAGNATPADVRRGDAIEAEIKQRGGAKAAQLGPLLKGGPEQRIQALAELSAMPVNERWRVAEAAGDPKAALIAQLPRGVQARVVEGQMARRGNPDLLLPPKTTAVKDRKAQDQVIDKAMAEFLGPDLYRTKGSLRSPLREGALDYMAGWSVSWSKSGFEKGLRVMFGATARQDGSWQGGIGKAYGRKLELPDKWNEFEFEQTIARQGFDGAIYANGAKADPADVRANYRFEWAGEDASGATQYQLLNPAGKLLMQRGADGKAVPYLLTVPARPGGR